MGNRSRHVGEVSAGEDVAGAPDQLRHQLRLPAAPRCRPGGRVALGQGGEQLQRREVADRLGDEVDRAGSSRSRRVATSGSSRWCWTRATRCRRLGREPHPRADRAHQLHADDRVSPGRPLPMSCSRVPITENPDARPAGEGGRSDRRLHQVPVDRVRVVRVALRSRAGAPTRAAPGSTARAGRARLDDADGRRTT